MSGKQGCDCPFPLTFYLSKVFYIWELAIHISGLFKLSKGGEKKFRPGEGCNSRLPLLNSYCFLNQRGGEKSNIVYQIKIKSE